ncbi:MAG TPA: c-type cytochrome [Anaerolineales bacterium]|nr:c-type cytochrome [Anaerolineales bacterium]
MKRSEILSRILITAAVLGAVGTPLFFWTRTPLLHARMAEDGGWSPDVIQAETGEPLHLRLTSDDVVHGFAVGQMDMEAVDIEPGKVTDVTLIFDKPGIYTFFCTRWCGVNHWRMRGTIEVSGPGSPEAVSGPAPDEAEAPLYMTLGLNPDAPHDAPSIPSEHPSAVRGQELAAGLPLSPFTSADYYRAHSPYQLYEDLRTTGLTDPEKWDVVGAVWEGNTTAEALASGKELYAQNCAACHGENGAGDGVFADDLKAAGQASMQNMAGAENMMMQAPVDFTDPERILGASPALLQGKILRGGMGTGMPMWGSIFTEEQVWDLIAYIYSFQFEYQ